MNPQRIAALLFSTLLLAACAFGYQARGSLSDVTGEMRGKAYPGGSGGAHFALSDQAGVLTCDGLAFPPTIASFPGGCEGEQGNGVMRCSDGRELAFEWQALTCRSLVGKGADAQGNRLEFRVERH
jgi:hypothetical protein